MIGRAILIWSSVIVVAVNIPSITGFSVRKRDGSESAPTASLVQIATPNSARYYVLRANLGGHFEGKFRINGKSLDSMIDTGATFVTLNESDARSLGFGGNSLKFRYEVSTANGKVKAARVTLNSIEIGTVHVKNVEAMVLRGKALNFPLIGMSFLKKLSSYEAANDELRLFN